MDNENKRSLKYRMAEWFSNFSDFLSGLLDHNFSLVVISTMVVILAPVFVILYSMKGPDETVEKRMYEDGNLTLDTVPYIDEGKVFKYDKAYYFVNKDGEILCIDWHSAKRVYEK